MDEPYNPACPLLIDSDDESFASGEEDIGKKVEDVWSKKMASFNKRSEGGSNSKGNQETGRFVKAFEDDNEELLDYCLRESGILSDDETKAKADELMQEKDSGACKNNEMVETVGAEEGDNMRTDKVKSNDNEKKEKGKEDVKSHRKKKKKHDVKERYKEKKERDSSNKSFEHRTSKEKKGISKVGKKVDAGSGSSNVRKYKNDEDSEDDINRSDGNDDDDFFENLRLDSENDAFPLSKMEVEDGSSRGSSAYKNEEKKRSKVKEKPTERSRGQSRKMKTSESSRKSDDERKSRKKRKRSKSSQKRSESEESDEPDRKKKRKRKHKEKSTERSREKHEKRKIEDSSHKSKEKYDSAGKQEKKHKKKKKHYEKKEVDKKSSHKDRDRRSRKDSESLFQRTPHAEKDRKEKSERQPHHHRAAESTSALKERNKRNDKIHENERRKRKAENQITESRRKHTSEEKDGKMKKDEVKLKSLKSDPKEEKSSDSKSRNKDKKNVENETGEMEEVSSNLIENGKKSEAKKEKVAVDPDTDSEFERLSDIEKEIEKEKSEVSSPEKLTKVDNVTDNEKKDADTKKVENIEQGREKHDISDEQKDEKQLGETEIENNPTDCYDPSSDVSKLLANNFSQLKKNETASEKRPFRLFSKEETQQLQEELSLKDDDGDVKAREKDLEENKTTDDEAEVGIKDDSDSEGEEKEKFKQELISVDDDVNEVQCDPQKGNSDMAEKDKDLFSLKPKDDLFDDIFSKEDCEDRDDSGMAKMYEKMEDTSPKRSTFVKHKLNAPSEEKVLDASEVNREEHSPKKTPKLKLEGGKYNGKKAVSPKVKSPYETVIPGLETVLIPGLESAKEKVGSEDSKVSSKIPLLFEDNPENSKEHGIPKTPEFSSSKEGVVKKRQPHTPPEEFIGEADNNQFDRYYHLEASESPYNPEDLTPIDMGLSPVDEDIIQQEALKGAVELRLKEPFSGFENPTWQKIIEAKANHEAKRQKEKTHESNLRIGIARNDQKSFKQQKLVNTLVRQSRVEQECKEVLKAYYKSKEITKEEYKDILRKAVPQVTMSNSPIIPEKIQSLMKKFVCKCKGQRLMSGSTKSEKKKKKTRQSIRSSATLSQALTFPGEKRFRYLNPDLPLPPL